MTPDVFGQQISKLRETYGERHYPRPRAQELWNVVKQVRDDVFTRAVSRLVLDQSKPPMRQDLQKAIEAIHAEDKQRARESASLQDMSQILKQAAKHTTADREFVQSCIKLVDDYNRGKINKKQFEQGCDLLDKTAAQIDPGGGPQWRFTKDPKGYRYLEDWGR